MSSTLVGRTRYRMVRRPGPPRCVDAPPAEPVTATVIACGAPERGDDGAAAAAVAGLEPEALAGIRVLVVGQLRVEELIDAAALGRVVVADAAVGLPPGVVAVLPFARLPFAARHVRPRSTHELPIVDTVGLAEMLLGRPLEGAIVALGVDSVAHGAPLSEAVRAALPRFALAIVGAARPQSVARSGVEPMPGVPAGEPLCEVAAPVDGPSQSAPAGPAERT